MKKNIKLGITGGALLVASIMTVVFFQSDMYDLSQIQIDELTVDSAIVDEIILKTSSRGYGTVQISSGSPILGSPDAPITIMTFFDYQCMGCKAWHDRNFPQIKENFIDTGIANMVYIDAGLTDENSLYAAEAAYCASDQKMYWQYHDMLYSRITPDTKWEKNENLKSYADELKLDTSRFEKCLDSGKYQKKVTDNTQNSKNNGISDVPITVVTTSDGRHHVFQKVTPYPVIESIIISFTTD